MTYFRFLLIPALWLAASPAFAGSEHAQRVVELFTSQGCSSCPPANEFTGKIAGDPDTLVLTYGVTYWDYLGWKDTFAQPKFTARQKEYARAFDSANVYTPQMVLNGSAHSSRYSKQDINSMTLPSSQNITLFNSGGVLSAKTELPNASDLRAVIVEYVRGPQSVPVEAGENRGRVLTVTNVVTDVKSVGIWSSGKLFSTNTRPKAGKSYALLLHDSKTMKLVSALKYTE